ncbi:MAG: sigma-70 family RNA polymerase sigma factor [Oscillospiraceae bacterium]|nr:sigma-70 family RNA polymerase sigma factor [Oscillospiraceae bacterium]
MADIGEDPQRFFEQLYADCYDFILAVVVKDIRNRSHADDIVQDTFMAAWDAAGRLRDHPNPAGWLVTAAKYKCLHFHRAVKQQRKLAEIMAGVHRGANPEALDASALLACLKPRDAEILSLFYIRKYSAREIAERLGVKEPSVRSRLARARKKLGILMDAVNRLK